MSTRKKKVEQYRALLEPAEDFQRFFAERSLPLWPKHPILALLVPARGPEPGGQKPHDPLAREGCCTSRPIVFHRGPVARSRAERLTLALSGRPRGTGGKERKAGAGVEVFFSKKQRERALEARSHPQRQIVVAGRSSRWREQGLGFCSLADLFPRTRSFLLTTAPESLKTTISPELAASEFFAISLSPPTDSKLAHSQPPQIKQLRETGELAPSKMDSMENIATAPRGTPSGWSAVRPPKEGSSRDAPCPELSAPLALSLPAEPSFAALSISSRTSVPQC
ncbi:hypothetical protein BDK51DRAFT_43295 [Blyttiomyces helicus]|uniref:Uncharacterized protein n=1 Tax=Blyttiomyces helicus TaxID=388810 RepID=A0A4P9WKF9_9FUNG|nr:hypothetical protein BDK51DRAFT_43295 [Blyttiomyces helicus]|eukprot:RKO92605.1 hypothetical protein BDK51DRAFT_43295 [Blyttiomyces helicus]